MCTTYLAGIDPGRSAWKLYDLAQETLGSFFVAKNIPHEAILFPLESDCHSLRADTTLSVSESGIQSPFIMINSGGEFHHRTYFLVKSLETPLSYVHIDAHGDTLIKPPEIITYSGFVHSLAQLAMVSEIHFFGLTPRKVYNWFAHEPFDDADRHIPRKTPLECPKYQCHLAQSVENWMLHGRMDKSQKAFDHQRKFIQRYLPDLSLEGLFTPDMISTPQVYISIDLDAIGDFPTNYMREGVMIMERIKQIVEMIGTGHEIIGADIVGLNARVQPEVLEAALNQIFDLYRTIAAQMTAPCSSRQ